MFPHFSSLQFLRPQQLRLQGPALVYTWQKRQSEYHLKSQHLLPASCGNPDISCLNRRGPAIITEHKRFSCCLCMQGVRKSKAFYLCCILQHIIASIFWSVVWISSIESMFSIFKSVILNWALETFCLLVLFLCRCSILCWALYNCWHVGSEFFLCTALLCFMWLSWCFVLGPVRKLSHLAFWALLTVLCHYPVLRKQSWAPHCLLTEQSVQCGLSWARGSYQGHQGWVVKHLLAAHIVGGMEWPL